MEQKKPTSQSTTEHSPHYYEALIMLSVVLGVGQSLLSIAPAIKELALTNVSIAFCVPDILFGYLSLKAYEKVMATVSGPVAKPAVEPEPEVSFAGTPALQPAMSSEEREWREEVAHLFDEPEETPTVSEAAPLEAVVTDIDSQSTPSSASPLQ